MAELLPGDRGSVACGPRLPHLLNFGMHASACTLPAAGHSECHPAGAPRDAKQLNQAGTEDRRRNRGAFVLSMHAWSGSGGSLKSEAIKAVPSLHPCAAPKFVVRLSCP